MNELRVGAAWNALHGKPEGAYFEIAESGPLWIFYYAGPTENEIEDISEGSPFEIRSRAIGCVLWLFVKCGGQDWAEAPYSPHLSRSAALEPITDDSSGYALTLVMVDKATNTVRHVRVIGLGNQFSRCLHDDVERLKSEPFDRNRYDLAIKAAQAAYATPILADMCQNRWKLG